MPNYRRIFENGYSYFITIVTHQRNPILIKNIELLRKSFAYTKSLYRFKIEAIVILPDHLHMIITPENADEYPYIVKNIKQYFSKYCDPKYYSHIKQSASRNKKGYKAIWQKRYFEHTIRDEKDFSLRVDYIHYNPVKHKLVESAGEWEYSSFSKYVEKGYYHKDWMNFLDDVDWE